MSRQSSQSSQSSQSRPSRNDIHRFYTYFLTNEDARVSSHGLPSGLSPSVIHAMLEENKPLLSTFFQAHPFFSTFLLLPRSVLPNSNPAFADLFDQFREVLFEIIIRPSQRRTAHQEQGQRRTAYQEFSRLMQKLDKLVRILRYILDDIPSNNRQPVLGYYLDRLASVIRPLLVGPQGHHRLSQSQQFPSKPSTPVRGTSEQQLQLRKVAIQQHIRKKFQHLPTQNMGLAPSK